MYCSRRRRGRGETVIHPFHLGTTPSDWTPATSLHAHGERVLFIKKSTIDVSILPGTVVNVGSGYAIAENHQATAL